MPAYSRIMGTFLSKPILELGCLKHVLHVYKLLFNGSKGPGSGCTTALSGMHRYLYRVYRLTPPTSLCSDNTPAAQINGEADIKAVATSKSKRQSAGNTPNTLILANRQRSNHAYKLIAELYQLHGSRL